MWKKRKAQKELQLIISLVILLVVAVVIISLFLQVFSDEPNPAAGVLERQEVITRCNRLCNNIKQSEGLSNKRRAIFNYCKRTYNFDPSSGEGKVTENVYIPSSGYLAFCKDKAHCFNFQEGMCNLGGTEIGPEVCREILCLQLTGQGTSQSDAEDKIENEIMTSGDCKLTQDAHSQDIYVNTWWEKYFEDVDCSGSPSNGDQDDDDDDTGGCNDVCGSGGATSPECVTEASCNSLMDLGHASSSEESSCSSGKVCCCR